MASYIDNVVLDPIREIKDNGPNYIEKIDSNQDSKPDLFRNVRNYKTVLLKRDRNFDGKVDYIKKCQDKKCSAILDDDYDGSFEIKYTYLQKSDNTLLKTYKNNISKRQYSMEYPKTRFSDSEGKFVDCSEGNCHSYEMIPEEECTRISRFSFECKNKIVAEEKITGHDYGYVNIFKTYQNGPQLFVADNCQKKVDLKKIVYTTQATIKKLLTCFNEKLNDPKFAQEAQILKSSTALLLQNRESPLKVQCQPDQKELRTQGTWAGSYQGKAISSSEEPDFNNSIVIGNATQQASETKLTELIFHEFVHLLEPELQHGTGIERATACSAACLSDLEGGTFSGIDKETAERNCFAEADITENLALKNSVEGQAYPAYSYLIDSFELLKFDPSMSTLKSILIETLIKEQQGGLKVRVKDGLPEEVEQRLLEALSFQAAEAGHKASVKDLKKFLDKQKTKTFSKDSIEEYGQGLAAAMLLYSNSPVTEDLENEFLYKLGVNDFKKDIVNQ
ncbi:MAG: hypothetical protein VX642_12620 [Bdellovibrionota bacterium]|nr:hypothetical protein [Bdellovibrionota bacterium]